MTQQNIEKLNERLNNKLTDRQLQMNEILNSDKALIEISK